MALDDQQRGGFKYFCRICKRGFMCGRALGGHMRAHGIESGNYDDDDPASDWEDRDNAPANKRFYALRTNPNRLKSCRSCENCGKEFMSWKSFLEHGKCNSNSDDDDGNESLPSSDGEEPRWSKRKRSLRAKVGSFNFTPPSSVEEDIAATCLVMLSNASVMADQPEESCASASREEERRNSIRFLPPAGGDKAKGVAKALFECKACKKVFNSHQALGGHRASHKKVKGCFAAKFDLADDDDAITGDDYYLQSAKPTSYYPSEHGGTSSPVTGSSRRKSKVHECSICHRIFSSGQALGGHKRCHWITSGLPETSPMNKFQHVRDQIDQINDRPSKIAKSDNLDLNMPAPGDELAGIRSAIRNPLSLHVSTEIHLQSWIDVDAERKNSTTVQNVDDEADSEVKLAKLSELKDLSNSGSSSPWLQVGIGSTTGGGSAADP